MLSIKSIISKNKLQIIWEIWEIWEIEISVLDNKLIIIIND